MRSKITALIALLLLVGASASAKEIWAKSYLGQKAPPLIVEKWLTAKPEMEGKFILVDFWATWCGPCLEAIPELNQIQKEFGARVCVVGISDERETTVRKMTAPKMTYAVAIDPKAKMKKAVEVRGIPHAMLIDPNGIVRWEGYPLLGGEELTSKVVRAIVAKYDVK
jgi:cytochrome c biogenesis protein CcmG, thiol:disulfide interchange protein DsbE